MRLGIDFDNTIVCYDGLFHRVAREAGWIPDDLAASKSAVRDHLRRLGREQVWTEMQGTVYGARILEATPYPGVTDFFAACRDAGIPVFIISHKTRHPFLGERHDLHAAALGWLERHGFFDPAGIGLPREHAFFELTKQAKLERIAAARCTHFIDDLPEFLAEPAFPAGVERLLFDPGGGTGGGHGFPALGSWTEIGHRLRVPVAGADQALARAELDFVARALGADAARLRAAPLPGGANNRVWRVAAHGRSFVLKRSFHAPDDPRDRFGAEHAFYQWAWSQGLRRTPEPVAADPEHRLGLFDFIEGCKLTPGGVDETHVAQAVAFIAELNHGRHLPQARALPIASEACFTVADHLARIGGRAERLCRFEPETAADHEAARFVRTQLVPAWERIRDAISARAAAGEDAPLAPGRRCLSPSDFGFHNALLPADGRLRFLDFEYAGWDDPAKLVCDFFCQPQVPVPDAHWPTVVDALDRALGWDGALPVRAALLLPAYRLKWCCIVLNDFLRTDRARREFARDAVPLEERKARQLAKARQLLAAAASRLTP